MPKLYFKNSIFEQICKTKNICLFILLLLFTSQSIFAQTNNCLAFDGTDDYVSLDLNDNLENTGKFTIEMWVNPAEINAGQSFFYLGKDYIYKIEIQDCTELGMAGKIAAIISNGQSSYGVTNDVVITPGQWFHLAMVFDGSLSNSNKIKLYINGELKSLTITGTLPTVTETFGSPYPPGKLGQGSSTKYFKGKMDEVRIWHSEARTQTEIQEYMNSTLGTRTGLLASYHFDETSGSTLKDNSGATNHAGTLYNFALTGTSSNWVSKVSPISQDNCLQFDGTNDYVNLAGLGEELDNKSALSIEMWCNVQTWTQYATLFSKYYANESRTQIQLNTTGNFLITVEQGTDAVVSQASTTTAAPVTAGQWFHLAVVFNGAGDNNEAKLKLYINGQAVGLTYVGTVNTTLNEVIYPAVLGAQGSGLAGGAFSNYFSGLMDEVKIWNVARTQVQVQQNMFSPIAGTEAGLVAYYNFNQGSAGTSNSQLTTLNDLSVESDWNSGTAAKNFGILTNFVLTGSTSNWVVSTFIAGSGTSGDPYQIANLNNLYWIEASTDRWNKYYIQTANIDASSTSTWDAGAGWAPIGYISPYFTGSYNGDGHTITGLYINRPGFNVFGFFGFAGTGSYSCTIKNLGLVGVNITGGGSIGGIAGVIVNGTISQCYTTGSVSGSWDYIGGLVGDVQNTTTISNCYSTASVSGRSIVGGFIGRVKYGTISYSYSTGGVSATTSTYIGGFVGYQENSSAIESFWNTSTSLQSTSALGTVKTWGEMKDNVRTYSNAGWDISECNPTWNKNSTTNDGYPFLQWQYPTENPALIPPTGAGTNLSPYLITNINNLLWIVANETRLAYYYKQTANIDMSCSNTWFSNAGWYPIGNSTNKFTGTYDGDRHTITGLNINRPSTNAIGFFGYTGPGCTITELGLVDVSITGGNGTGGLGGYIYNSTVSKCFTTGSVIGVQYVGGFGGSVFYNSITDCYTRASVSALSNSVGGFAGEVGSSTTNFTYSTGLVTASAPVGGFVGSYYGGTTNNSFWDTQTSDKGSSAVGTGKTTLEMKTPSTFSAWSSTTWAMDSEINNGYAYLLWQNPDGSPLPVELSTFTATSTGSTVKLNWNTATEVNNYGFEILRQTKNEEEWTKIGFVTGNGNSNSIKSYSFVDDFSVIPSIHSDKYSYKLKQIDNEGQFTYSNIIEVDLGIPQEFSLSQNYPNPFNPTTTIRFSLPVQSSVVISLYNSLGQQIAKMIDGNFTSGVHEFNFDASSYASGIYFYTINANGVNGKNFTSSHKMALMK